MELMTHRSSFFPYNKYFSFINEEVEKILKKNNCRLFCSKKKDESESYEMIISKIFFIEEEENVNKEEKIIIAEEISKIYGVIFNLYGEPNLYAFSCYSNDNFKELNSNISKLNEIYKEFKNCIKKYKKNKKNNILTLTGLF